MKQKSAACIVSLEFHIRIVIKKVGFNFNVKTRYLRVFDDHFFFLFINLNVFRGRIECGVGVTMWQGGW